MFKTSTRQVALRLIVFISPSMIVAVALTIQTVFSEKILHSFLLDLLSYNAFMLYTHTNIMSDIQYIKLIARINPMKGGSFQPNE